MSLWNGTVREFPETGGTRIDLTLLLHQSLHSVCLMSVDVEFWATVVLSAGWGGSGATDERQCPSPSPSLPPPPPPCSACDKQTPSEASLSPALKLIRPWEQTPPHPSEPQPEEGKEMKRRKDCHMEREKLGGNSSLCAWKGEEEVRVKARVGWGRVLIN